jgi:hypothetical protein
MKERHSMEQMGAGLQTKPKLEPEPSAENTADKQEKHEDDPIIRYRLSLDDLEVAKRVYAEDKEKVISSLREASVDITPEQKKLSEATQRYTESLAQKYSVPENKKATNKRYSVVFLPLDEFKKQRLIDKDAPSSTLDALAFYMPPENAVVLWYRTARDAQWWNRSYYYNLGKHPSWDNDDGNDVFLHTLTHELYHAESFRSLQAFKGPSGEPEVIGRRIGLHIYRLRVPEKNLFREINEAITEELAIATTNQIVNENREEFKPLIMEDMENFLETARITDPWMKRAYDLGYAHSGFDEWMRTQDPAYTKNPNRNREEELKRFEEFIESDEHKNNDAKIRETIFQDGYQFKLSESGKAYSRERGLLNRIITAVAKKNEDYKGKKEDVRNLFYEAYFSGSMLKLGRVIEKTFGKGAFRLMAEKPFSRDLSKRLR